MKVSRDKIAVIGMACRFPGANNVEEYWSNLLNGKESITRFSDAELSKSEYRFDEIKDNPAYVRARGILENIDKFDAEFFGMTPREAAMTDPQHRIWLETAWQAFENAGCDPMKYTGAIGVFTGGCINTYLLNNVLRDPVRLENYIRLRLTDSLQIMTGNDAGYIPTKTAFKFNLRGPAINIQTACSTSLVAISEACQSLISFKSDICLAGAICIQVPQETGYIYEEGAIISPDGFCRPFDAKGRGTVFSNGVGAVVLKRLDDAVKDRDRIYAVVSGWAVNNDGNNKLSYMAPSIDGQAEVIRMAHLSAGVQPEEISYVEAHGTGTQLGDPIEIAGLKKAFGIINGRKQYCGLGSVKSNIGHTDVASGVASFIKTCLAAYYKKIPRTINFSELNPHIDIENSPFYIQDQPKEWKEDKPLIMGVSSFGVGGTNAHVIVEEIANENKNNGSEPEWPGLLLLSARSQKSLAEREADLLNFLKTNSSVNVHDVAFTLGAGRNHMSYRSFAVADNLNDFSPEQKLFTSGKTDNLISKTAFMFPGQGAQYISMGKGLYETNSLFRQLCDECFEIVKSETGEDLKKLLFESTDLVEAEKRLADTEITQPSLFIIEYALAKVLEQVGIKPSYLIGHSIGEYTAACMAGVFDMGSALRIVIKRGRLMQKMQPGKMMAVKAGVSILRTLDNSCFEIAAENAPELCTISFNSEKAGKVTELLDSNNLQYLPLNTSHAFHSEAFDPILSEFSEFVNQFSLNAPELPFISCLTGEFITNEQAVSGKYWAQQLRNTVLFRKGISTISGYEDVIFLEVGPNTHLTSLVRQNKNVENKKAIIPTFGKPDNISEQKKVLAALGNMFIIGINIDINILQKGFNPCKIGLPGYPFDEKRHWIDHEVSGYTDSLRVPVQNEKVPDHIISNDISGGDAPTVTPITGTAGIILSIWKSLTGIDEIGLDEDFFDLGGQSLLALQIMTRIKEELNFNISLKTFYDNPTINKLSSIIKESDVSAEPKLVATGIKELRNFPLTPHQKGIWISTKFNNLNPAYNIPFTHHFRGDINYDVLQRSVNFLFNRHPVIFSVFGVNDGVPYFDINPRPVKIELLDYASDPAELATKKTYAFIGEDSRSVFDIETGPLYRLYLIKLSDSEYYFHATIHHLVFDGWSWNLFVNELATIYKNLSHGTDPKLEDIDFQYYDYALWQENNDNKLKEEASKKYWTEYLKGCSSKLDFPYDHARTDMATGFGGKEFIHFPKDLTTKLKEIGLKENTTLFPLLLSSLAILIQKYSGQNDFCLGMAAANRAQSKLEKIFGMFVNTTLLRFQIEQTNNFMTLLRNTSSSVMDAISYGDLTFEKLVDSLKVERSLNMNPLFQIALVWLSNSALPMNLGGIKGERVTVDEGVSPFDISFYMWENEGCIEGEIEYNIDILERDTIIRLKNNFISLVESLTENPVRNISEIKFISDTEKALLNQFNNTEKALPVSLAHTSIERMAATNRYRTAIISENKSWTYQELDNLSNQLANYLSDQGVAHGDVVGICIERSFEMVVSVLAVLKSGGCYLPMDPSFPDDRLKYMFEDSGARVIISQSSLREKFNQFNNASIILTDTDKSKINKCSPRKQPSEIQPQSLAYIIYTSGSTGKPKGVKVQHEAVVNLIDSMSIEPGISQDDILLAVVTLSFDMSVFELFLPLSRGATVVIANSLDTTDGSKLIDLLDKYNITMLQATPSLWNILIANDWKGKKNLRGFCGGEALTKNLVKQIFPKVSEFWNCYGPTETTVYSTIMKITDPNANILVGKPIGNTRIYILDKNFNQVPVGVIGEVCIGGLGVTKGYNNRPELTSEKFIVFGEGQTIYRTGDIGRFLPDGNIELFGRIDNQIKLRGFRIEPGEIENLLTQINGIKEAVVKIHKFDENDERLVAFINVDSGFSLQKEEVLAFLSHNLPAYMIPSFVQVSFSFPRLPNGKTDKKALILEASELLSGKKKNPDVLSDNEKKIYEIWSDVLKTKNISLNDNFFEIGGNSLLAITVMSKIKSTLRVDLNLRIFFDSPRIKDLADAIDIHIKRKSGGESVRRTDENQMNIVQGEI
jgi:amino acid adenylation domain-containing protein